MGSNLYDRQGLADFYRFARRALSEEDPEGLLRRGSEFALRKMVGATYSITGKQSRGTPIYEEEWDALVILDACRYDVMKEVADDFSWIDRSDLEEFTSLGSASTEWMRKNFGEDFDREKGDTLMVTGNGFAGEYLDEEDFQHVEKVWEYGWDEDLGTVMPGAVTEKAIRLSRQMDWDRMIIHYMQPHHPFVTDPDLGEGISQNNMDHGPFSDHVWGKLQRGEVEREEVWERYRENLELVLEYVEVLKHNIDADPMVISADHGNSFGRLNKNELGITNHPEGIATDALREVPWLGISAEDEGTVEFGSGEMPETPTSVEDQLEILGYID